MFGDFAEGCSIAFGTRTHPEERVAGKCGGDVNNSQLAQLRRG
jgi:hypothetical protein